MTGTFINVAAIVAGSGIGAFAGSRLPGRIRQTVLYGLGLVIMLIGFQMANRTENVLVVLGAIVLGGIIGETFNIEDRLARLGEYIQGRFARGSGSFAEGFVTASLVFCVGPMAILGSIEDGLSGDFRLLSIKAVLDGLASVAFAASMGWGTILSAVSVLLYQGAMTLFANGLSGVLTQAMITEMSATGGLIIIGIGIRLLDIRNLRLANFVPAIAVAPVLVALIPVIKGFL